MTKTTEIRALPVIVRLRKTSPRWRNAASVHILITKELTEKRLPGLEEERKKTSRGVPSPKGHLDMTLRGGRPRNNWALTGFHPG
jgi:hypothetical protein